MTRMVWLEMLMEINVFINTVGWSRGTYVITANANGKETSCKVFVN